MSSDKNTSRDDISPAIPSNIDQMVLLGDARLDAVMTAVVALGSELWTAKRRMKVVERLLAEQGVSQEDIESYQPTREETAQWNADRDLFISALFGHLTDLPKANGEN